LKGFKGGAIAMDVVVFILKEVPNLTKEKSPTHKKKERMEQYKRINVQPKDATLKHQRF
jgi:hypothetical protein